MKRKYKTTKTPIKRARRNLMKTSGLVMDVGVAGAMISTARGLKV